MTKYTTDTTTRDQQVHPTSMQLTLTRSLVLIISYLEDIKEKTCVDFKIKDKF